MDTTRLCRFCQNFKLGDAFDGLRATDHREVYRISHAEFFECASSCDICEVTAQHFLENVDPQATSKDEATADIRASVRKYDGKCQLVFFVSYSEINWHMVNWMVWTSKGSYVHN